MRLLVALGVMIALLLSVECYLRFSGAREAVAPTPSVQPTVANQEYKLELSLSYDATADAFAFSLDAPTEGDASASQVSLLIKLNGKELRRRDDIVRADSPIVIENIPVGTNEFFLEVAPNADAPGAARLQLKRDGTTVAQQVFWAEAGDPLSDIWRFEIAPHSDESKKQSHD